MQYLTPWLGDQKVTGFSGVGNPLDSGFAGLAEEEDPLARDLVEEEEGDLCSLCNGSLYGHSFVFVVLFARPLV